MTMQQFHQLSEMEKVSTIMEHGKLMAQHTEADDRVFIYRLESFYVSACYSITSDQLKAIQCYLEAAQLNPYYRKQLTAVHPAERQYDTPKT